MGKNPHKMRHTILKLLEDFIFIWPHLCYIHNMQLFTHVAQSDINIFCGYAPTWCSHFLVCCAVKYFFDTFSEILIIVIICTFNACVLFLHQTAMHDAFLLTYYKTCMLRLVFTSEEIVLITSKHDTI